MRFKNKVAVITGGASGIGFTAADCFASEGAHVVICSRGKNVIRAARRLKERYRKQKIMPFVADVGEKEQVRSLFKGVISKLGKIDILVNGAGISEPGKIEEITLERWSYIIKNNLTNCFLCCKYVLPYMKKRRYGKIINISSIAGRFRSGLAGAHYTSAKAAVIAFTRQLAYEIARYNINANVLCPSQTMTPMLEKFLTPKSKKKLEESIPLGYIASPIQQAKVILFLASDDSNYMTGAAIDVNGGQL